MSKNKKVVPTAKTTTNKSFFASLSDKQLSWLLGILAFILYSVSIQFDFVLDDVAVIQENNFVHEGIAGIPKILTSFYWEGYWNLNSGIYRPLSLIMFAIEWSISPNNPVIHHFVQVLLYAFTSVLLFKVLRRLFEAQNRYLIFSIALLFVLHPAHTEVVANIKSRDEILCLLFILLTFNLLLKNEKLSISKLVLTATFFFLALLSKEGGIVFLGIAFFAFYLIKHFTIKETFLKLAPLFAVSILWFVLHQSIISTNSNARVSYNYHDNSLLATESIAAQKATALGLISKYAKNSIYPFSLSYDYSFNQIQVEKFPSLKSGIGILVIAFIIYFALFYRKKHPQISFGLIWFLISIALICNLFFIIGTTYADRLLFIPSIGILISLVFAIHYISAKISTKNATSYFLGTIVLLSFIYSFRTINRTKDWASNATLFTADLTASPNNGRVQYNYGILQLNFSTDSIVGAKNSVPYFLKAIEIDSNENLAIQSLGVAYFRLEEYQKSLQYSLKSIALFPEDIGVNGNIADAYFNLNDFENAIKYYKKFEKSNTIHPGHFERFGLCYFTLKKYDDAIQVFIKGHKKFPDYLNLSLNLGNCYGAKGDYANAIKVFSEILTNNPKNKQVVQLLILSYNSIGDQENVVKFTNYLNSI